MSEPVFDGRLGAWGGRRSLACLWQPQHSPQSQSPVLQRRENQISDWICLSKLLLKAEIIIACSYLMWLFLFGSFFSTSPLLFKISLSDTGIIFFFYQINNKWNNKRQIRYKPIWQNAVTPFVQRVRTGSNTTRSQMHSLLTSTAHCFPLSFYFFLFNFFLFCKMLFLFY